MIKSARLFLLLSIVCTVLLVFTVQAAVPAYAADIVFDSSPVLDDLQSDKGFSINDYPFNNEGDMSLIQFVEYCYSAKASQQSNYGLYLYIYNPKGLNIDTANLGNKVQLATSFDDNGKATAYEKFKLEYCNKSTGDYKNLFYKFRVKDHKSSDGKNILQRINSAKRVYSVSGIELVTYGSPTAIDYKIGYTYTYSGFSSGYGSEQSTLACNIEKLKTVSLDVNDVYYRTGVSSLGAGHQNQLNSVYFAVDNSILEEYGKKLQEIRAEWYEYRTSPIIVTEDAKIYTKILPYIGFPVPEFNKDIYYSLYEGSETLANWAWNSEKNVLRAYDELFLSYIFSSGATKIKDYTVSSEDLLNYIYNYEHYNTGTLPIKNGTISADLFSDEVDAGHTRGYNLLDINADDTFDMMSYKSTHEGWEKFWSNFWGIGATLDDDYYDVSPIYKVQASDMLVSNAVLAKTLMIDESFVSAFKKFYSEATLQGKSVFLFRYSVTDYYSKFLAVTEDKLFDVVDYTSTYKAYETVFLDFDIITLTFNKDGVMTVLPVVSNPKDIAAAISAPIIGGNLIDRLKKEGKDWLQILAIILAVILLLLFLPLIIKIVKLLVSIITIPFQVIGKSIRKSNKQKKVKNE